MKLWLDDIRDPKIWSGEDGWVWAKTAEEAISHINLCAVTEISLDHDLGGEIDRDDDELNGYSVACHIEFMAHQNLIPRIIWHIHSANPVGRHNMEIALKQADKYWSNHENNQ